LDMDFSTGLRGLEGGSGTGNGPPASAALPRRPVTAGSRVAAPAETGPAARRSSQTSAPPTARVTPVAKGRSVPAPVAAGRSAALAEAAPAAAAASPRVSEVPASAVIAKAAPAAA